MQQNFRGHDTPARGADQRQYPNEPCRNVVTTLRDGRLRVRSGGLCGVGQNCPSCAPQTTRLGAKKTSILPIKSSSASAGDASNRWRGGRTMANVQRRR
eukprot:6295453-Lingulodinium_polyedra.AAC.1